MKATEQYFPKVLYVVLYRVVLPFESVDEILKCNDSNESYWAVLPWSAVYYAVQNGSTFAVCLHEIPNCDPHWNRNTIEHVLSGPVLFGVFQTKIFETCFRFVLVALFGNIFIKSCSESKNPVKIAEIFLCPSSGSLLMLLYCEGLSLLSVALSSSLRSRYLIYGSLTDTINLYW